MTKREGELRIIKNIIENDYDSADETQQEALSGKDQLIKKYEEKYKEEEAVIGKAALE